MCVEYYHIIYLLFFILYLALGIFFNFMLFTAQNVRIIRRLKNMINMLYYFVFRILLKIYGLNIFSEIKSRVLGFSPVIEKYT